MIQWAARESAGMITVCAALKDGLVEARRARRTRSACSATASICRFSGRSIAQAARATLGLTAPTLLSVGHLIPRKGHDLVIRRARAPARL